ncbi:hypothetical protein JZ751_003303 [Albula glossodonta]|uniref:MARVEL domain-containing protein n=1 Tax=Albula glossodonta TaxID=121402 RepID=A0A8T2N6W4_9TELE|nr:hypothetical protein JZ751_003303 [Albula glossodonta]
MADTTETGGVLQQLKSYVTTRKGTILAAEILLSLIILICYAASRYGGYTAVAICEMVFAIVFLVIFMLNLDKQFKIVFGLVAGILFGYDAYITIDQGIPQYLKHIIKT